MAIPGNIGSKKSSSNPFGMAASKGSMPTPGISAASPATRKEITRQQFFKGRPDVSDDRLVRRQTQADELRAFKQGLTIAPGTTNLYQEQAPTFNPMTGRYERTTLADKSRELALKYGPTFSEIGSDIGYGLGSIAKGAGDFIGRGGVIGSVLSGLYDKFKSGTQQGIETVGGLYDNLRKTLGGGKPPVASYGGSSDIRVTDNIFLPTQGYDSRGYLPEGFSNVGIEQPQFPYNFETMIKPKPDPLQPSEMSEEQFMESYPELYSGNPLFKQQTYQPIKVQDVDPSRLLVQNFNIPTVEDVVEQLSDYYNAYEKGVNLKTPVGDFNLNPARQEIFLGNSLPIGEDRSVFYTGSMNPNDMSYDVGIGTQLPYGVDFKLGASSNDVPGIGFSKRLGPINAGLGFSEEGSNLNLNTFVDPIRSLYPTSSIGLPLNIGATVSDIGKIIPNISLMKQFKKGGSVDKYAGLGYKLK
jgi:hypothetical protein